MNYPNDWSLVSLDQIAAKEKGAIRRGPFGGSIKKDCFVSSGYKVYEQKNAIESNFEIGSYFIDEKKYQELEGFSIKSQDLIISCAGTIGRVAIIPDEAKPGVINQALMRIRPNREVITPHYLKWYLQSPAAKREIFGQVAGTALKNLAAISKIKQSKIPLPPLNEQNRIVSILDKADAIQRSRKKAIALTEELLRSTFLDMFGDPVTNPKGWSKVKLDAIVSNIDSGWSPKCDSREASSDEWGILKLGSVTQGYFNSSENKALLPETKHRPELEVKKGDLLFSRKNTYELVGATAYVHNTRPKLLLPDLIFRFCLLDTVDPVYLWQALSRKTMRNELSRLASGSSGSMPNISKARLKNLLIPLPPLNLQLEYKEIVNTFWSCKESQQKNTLEADNLFNSLLQKAFRGEL